MEILGREPSESEQTILRRIPIFDGEIITFMEPIRFLIDIRAAVAVIPGLELSELLLKKTTGFAREYVENMVLKQRLCWNNEYAHKKLDSDMTEDLINGFGNRFCPPKPFLDIRRRCAKTKQKLTESTDEFISRVVDKINSAMDIFNVALIEEWKDEYISIHSIEMWGRLLKKELILCGLNKHIHPWARWFPQNVSLGEVIQRCQDVDRRRPYSNYRDEHAFNTY